MNKYTLFDTHAHYDHPLFQGKGADIISSLMEKGIMSGVVIPAITYDSNFNRVMFPEDKFDQVFFAAGLHPKYATNEVWWNELKQREFLEVIVNDPRTVAIKTGLDFSNKKLTDEQKEHQIRFFKYFIEIANDRKLPLVLHIRDAVEETIEVIKDQGLQVEAVAHCFTYDSSVADRMSKVGVTRFGIGGMLTRDGMDSLRECVRKLPLSTILIETDAPFVKPKDFEGKVNDSSTLLETAGLIAELRESSLENVVRILQKNAAEFYRI